MHHKRKMNRKEGERKEDAGERKETSKDKEEERKQLKNQIGNVLISIII